MVPRLIHGLVAGRLPVGEDWTGTTIALPPSLGDATRWRNALTGAELSSDSRSALAVPDLLAAFPFALLVAAESTR